MDGKFFRVRFDSNLFIGLLSGIAMLLLSFGMNCFPGNCFFSFIFENAYLIPCNFKVFEKLCGKEANNTDKDPLGINTK